MSQQKKTEKTAKQSAASKSTASDKLKIRKLTVSTEDLRAGGTRT